MNEVTREDLKNYLLHEAGLHDLAAPAFSTEDINLVKTALICDTDGSVHASLEEERLKLVSQGERIEASIENISDSVNQSEKQQEHYLRLIEPLIPEKFKSDFLSYIGKASGIPSEEFIAFLETNEELDRLFDQMIEAMCKAL